MPRDKYGIQRMFNFGGTRFYGGNTDFDNKAYYRNRDGRGGGNLTPPSKIAGDVVKAGQGGGTTAFLENKYNKYTSNDAAKASA